MEENGKAKQILSTLGQIFKKKNALFILGIAGILLIFLSDTLFKAKEDTTEKSQQTVQGQVQADTYVGALEKRLTELITSVQGAGKATVMITLDTSGETIYARNEQNDTETQSAQDGIENRKSSYESEYAIVDSGNSEEPIVEAQLLPEIKGVAVVCEGGDDIAVISRVTELVSVVLGLSTNRICVTKMI